MKHIRKLERIQRMGIKIVPELGGMTYKERLIEGYRFTNAGTEKEEKGET